MAIDEFIQKPIVRFRSLLDTGSAVETIGRLPSDVPASKFFGPNSPLDVALLRGNSINRRIRLVDGAGPAGVYAEHQANLSQYTASHGGAPIVHATMAQVVDLWKRGAAHDIRTRVRVKWVPVAAAMLCFAVLTRISIPVTDSVAQRLLPVTTFTIFLVHAIWLVLGTSICVGVSIFVWSVLSRTKQIRPKFE